MKWDAIVRRSDLSKDSSGKDLSDGWAVNFAVGCTHGCLFCYVDRIWRL
jgi:DNA repair photolyase